MNAVELTKPHGTLLAEPLETPSLLARVFKAFQYRDFRLMWIGACTSSIGTWMQIVAQGWLIYRLSHSAFLLALDQFLGGIPIFLFSLIGGVVADRVERRRILLGSQYVQMATAGLLTILVTTGLVHVWHILCLSFISGLAQSFGGPAYQALIPTLVEKDDMPNAIALNSIQFNVAVMVGPALAGQALAKLGEKWCFGLNALSFLAPIVSLSIISARFLPAKTTASMFASLKQGTNCAPAEFHGGTDPVGLLHDCPRHAHAHLHPGIRKDISIAARKLLKSAGLDGTGVDLWFAGDRERRQLQQWCWPGGTGCADLLGAGHFPPSPSRSRCRSKRHYPRTGRRLHDGGLRHGKFPGAADHHQRDARPRDERLQRRLPRRHADGQSAIGMARPGLYRAGGAGGEWFCAHPGCSLFPATATAARRSLRPRRGISLNRPDIPQVM